MVSCCAGGRGDPERKVFGVATAKDLTVRVDVAVDRVGDELWYLTFIDAMGLGVFGWNVEPPAAVDVDEGVRDGEGGKVLDPDGMQGQECDEQSVADTNGARQRCLAEHLRFTDQDETGFDQTLGQDEPVGL